MSTIVISPMYKFYSQYYKTGFLFKKICWRIFWTAFRYFNVISSR